MTTEIATIAPENGGMDAGETLNRSLAGPNSARVEFARDSCIHDLFAEQVRRTPNKVALIFSDERMTYAELNEKANSLACRLRQCGIRPDVPVGICIERSLEMMVGLLGILKAGGCYVPLDPTYPKERLAFILADAQPPVLLTQTSLRDGLALGSLDAEVICVDDVQGRDRNGEVSDRPNAQSSQ